MGGRRSLKDWHRNSLGTSLGLEIPEMDVIFHQQVNREFLGVPISYLRKHTAVDRLLGRVVDSVIEQIPNASRTADNVLETSLAPVELLDVLGFSGHRVVGVSSKNNKMVWTLESEQSHREL